MVELPADVFEGELSAPQIHYDKLTKVEPRLRELVGKIAPYQIDPESIDAKDENLLKAIDGLRRTLEVIYQQRLTFKGEAGRAPSGPLIEGEVDVDMLRATWRVFASISTPRALLAARRQS